MAVETVPYATPVARPNIWAAVVLSFVGLGLIGLGGCFLIGILLFHIPATFMGPTAQPLPWTGKDLVFIAVLYLLALACFSGGFYILFKVCVRMFGLLGGK